VLWRTVRRLGSTLPGSGGVWRFDPGPDRWSVVSASNPFPESDGAVYDTRHGRLITYVDYRFNPESQNPIPVDFVNETWAFDPVTGVWENRHPAQTPPPGLLAGGAQLAYNARWDKIVMFGGLDLVVYQTYLEGCGPAYSTCDDSLLPLLETNHTWVYDYSANTWTDMAPALSPPARNSHALVYDAAADRVILFGGGDAFVDYDDTWAYDYHHNTWTQLQPAVRPAPRAYGFMAYNGEQDRIVLFGGVDYTETQIYGDTWMFNYWDHTWTPRNPTVSPSPRGWFGMTYSARANEVVIFGGGTDRDHFTDETWLYRLASDKWIQVTKP
jgi:N-acetylneuraminic acid mutarotase